MNIDDFDPSSASPGDLVTAAADLGRREAERTPKAYDLSAQASIVVNRLRHDERVMVTDLEKHLSTPRTIRGEATLHDPADFSAYVQRLAEPDYTTVWVEPKAGRITAVFDDHADSASPGWRGHRATLALQPDPDWALWMKLDGQRGNQVTLADHFESLAHTVVDPDSATMLELAQTFDAKRNVNFRSGIRTDNGDIELTYEEQTQAKAGRAGQMEIPREFTILVSPFLGVAPAELRARLRWRIAEGQLAIGYSLLRPDKIRDDLIASLVGEIRERIDPLPVHMGTPPPRVSPL